MERNKKKILWITRTAIFIAMIIVIQVVTKPFSTLITGSLVNLILIVSVMTCGFSSGLVVAVLSPAFATLFGISPLVVLMPFIAIGNGILILLWNYIGSRAFKGNFIGSLIALVAGAAGKFLFLYFSIVQIMLPMFLTLPAKQEALLSASFSLSQLFTALIGGVLAILVLPIIKKATLSRER